MIAKLKMKFGGPEKRWALGVGRCGLSGEFMESGWVSAVFGRFPEVWCSIHFQVGGFGTWSRFEAGETEGKSGVCFKGLKGEICQGMLTDLSLALDTQKDFKSDDRVGSGMDGIEVFWCWNRGVL